MCAGCVQLTGYSLDVYAAALTRASARARKEFVKAAAPELLDKLTPLIDKLDKEGA